MSNISDADKALLAGLDAANRDQALTRINTYLDGLSPVLTTTPPPLEDVLGAVMLAAGIAEPVDPATVEEPTAEMVEARQDWSDRRFTILGSLSTVETMFARSAEALLAYLVRIAAPTQR